jgi:DNA-binding transcriptional regulator YiaG
MNMATDNTKRTRSRAAKNSGFGHAVLDSLQGWERGEPLTIRHVSSVPKPRPRTGAEVKRLRTHTLGVSQSVFAGLVGVSVKLVEAWEAGRNAPSRPVCRLFELIERDPHGFMRRYAKGAA